MERGREAHGAAMFPLGFSLRARAVVLNQKVKPAGLGLARPWDYTGPAS